MVSKTGGCLCGAVTYEMAMDPVMAPFSQEFPCYHISLPIPFRNGLLVVRKSDPYMAQRDLCSEPRRFSEKCCGQLLAVHSTEIAPKRDISPNTITFSYGTWSGFCC